MVDDRQRHEHRAAPGTHLVEVHVEPFADQDDLAGNGRHIFPGEQAQQRQIELREGVHARHAPEVQRHFARAQHARVGDRHAGQLQRQVSFDRRIHLRRAAVIDVPAAVRQLHREDVIHRLALPLGIHLAVPMVVGDHVRHQRRIHHQFADPVAFGLLLAEQIALRPLNRGFQLDLRLEPEVLLTRAFLDTVLSQRYDIHAHTLRNQARHVKRLPARPAWKRSDLHQIRVPKGLSTQPEFAAAPAHHAAGTATTFPLLTDLASASAISTALRPSRAVTTLGAFPLRIASSM